MSSSQRKYRAPRGMRDILPDEVPAWELLERTAGRLARERGFREIRPPLMEETDLFTRSVGEVTDIVEKEMFSLQKGDTRLSLRPEGTAGIARAYLQAGWEKNAPVQRLFYVGPMFRYERPQKGRERQFTQFDVECIGTVDPRIDAEVITLAVRFFEALGLEGLEVRVNSMGDERDRGPYRDAVRAFLADRIHLMSELAQERFERNVFRVLDSKDPRDREALEGVPALLDHLCPENREHFDTVVRSLEDVGTTVVVDPSIVRGMDYYTHTVFEVHSSALGARSAMCGGGRYDHLLRDLGGPDLGAVGFAIGFSGTLIVLRELGLLEGVAESSPAAYVVAADPACRGAVFRVAEQLRNAGVGAVFDVEQKSFKAQLKAAGRGGHRAAVLLGPDELERGVVQLKDLALGEQVEVAADELVVRMRELLARPASPVA